MRHDPVRLLQTLDHSCGYYAGRMARNLVIDPLDPRLGDLYETALQNGFRRAGGHVYRPNCRQCQACISCRIPVAEFRPSRSQRRCWKRNQDLRIDWREASDDPEARALYERYVAWRHPGGGMDEPGPEDFRRFLIAPWGASRFMELRLDGELVAVAVTDRTPSSLSAVYTFFSPSHSDRGLGVFCVLRQIEHARECGLQHLYLGYWIPDHPKMDYKARFQPMDILQQGAWRRVRADRSGHGS